MSSSHLLNKRAAIKLVDSQEAVKADRWLLYSRVILWTTPSLGWCSHWAHRELSLTSNAHRRTNTWQRPTRNRWWKNSRCLKERESRRTPNGRSCPGQQPTVSSHHLLTPATQVSRTNTMPSSQRIQVVAQRICWMKKRPWRKICQWTWSMTCLEQARRDNRKHQTGTWQVRECKVSYNRMIDQRLACRLIFRSLETPMRESRRLKTLCSLMATQVWINSWRVLKTRSQFCLLPWETRKET